MAKTHRHNTLQAELNRPRTRPYAPTGLGGGSLSRFLSGRSRFRRTRMPVRRTSPSTRSRRYDRTPRGRSSRRRRQRPRRRLTPLWQALQPLHRRQRRHVSNAGRRSRFRFVPRTERHSLLLLPTTATLSSADVPWLPVSSGEPTQHPASSWQQPLEPQFPATGGGSTHDAKLPFASNNLADSALSISAHTVEP